MRILVVEDEHKIARAIKEGLEEESYAVDLSFDGQEGLNAARYEEYDLIILDRMLPGGMDGAEICETLRREGNHTPVLMLTARDQVRDRVQGLNSGADDYVVKPFSFEELLARVKALLRRPHESLGYKPPAPEVFVPAFAAWPAAQSRPAPPATLAHRPTMN